MQAGIYRGERSVTVQEVNRPGIVPGEALIRVRAAGICGTDMTIFAGKHPRVKPPTTLGHEFCGVIEAVAPDSGFAAGDRIVVEPTLSCGTCEACMAGQNHVCRTLGLVGIDRDGGFAEYVSVPVHRLHRIPDELPDTLAAMAEPVAVCVHAVRRSGIAVGDRIAVLGCGPIGLMVAMVARQAGAGQVIISDISEFRLAQAKALGFTTIQAKDSDVPEKIRLLTDGQGADVVFEAAGTPITASQMITAPRIQGRVMVVSLFKQPIAVDVPLMTYREITLLTTRCYSHDDFARGIRLMAAGELDLSPLISHILPLSRLLEGLSLMANADAALKILIKP